MGGSAGAPTGGEGTTRDEGTRGRGAVSEKWAVNDENGSSDYLLVILTTTSARSAFAGCAPR